MPLTPKSDQITLAAPAPPSFATPSPAPKLRAEGIGYFDPEYQEEGKKNDTPIINAGKHVFYKDVFVFTERLKDLAKQHGDETIERLITSCLRGTVLR